MISSLFMRARYLKASLALLCSSAFMPRTEELLEEAFLHQLVDDAVVDDLVEIEPLEIGRDALVHLLGERGLDGTGHHVGHAFEDVAFLVQVVDARHVRFRLLVERDVGLHGERLVVVEPLDGFGVRLDDRFGELRVVGRRLACEEIDRGQEDRRVIGEIGEDRVAGFLEPEVVRRRQQRGIGSAALQRRGAAADVGADRNPLDVARAEPERPEQGHGVVVRRVADLTDREALALEILRSSALSGPRARRAPCSTNCPSA